MTGLEWIAWGCLFCTVALFGLENSMHYSGGRQYWKWIDYHFLQLAQTGLVGLLAILPTLSAWEAYGAILAAMPFFQAFINLGEGLGALDVGERRSYRLPWINWSPPKPLAGRLRVLQFGLSFLFTFELIIPMYQEALRWIT